MRKREKVHDTTRTQSRFPVGLTVGLGGLSGIGVSLWLLGPAAGYVLGLLLLLVNLCLVWTAIFSSREEPSQRLLRLIKALRRRRDR